MPVLADDDVVVRDAQLHGVSRCGLEAEHADDFPLPQRDPKATASLPIVCSDVIHFFGQ